MRASLLALICYALAFAGARHLTDPDEGRYSAVSLEMLSSGDWLQPRLHPDLPHFTKPPLTYWATAASFFIFGKNQWGARIPLALAFLATILAVYRIGRYLCPKSAWRTAAIYSTLLLPYGAANILTTDTFLTLWETLAALAFIRFLWGEAGRSSVHMMWMALGMAFLTKGPPTLLVLAPIVVFMATTSGWRSIKKLFPWTGLLLFAAIGLTWYLILALKTPGLLDYWLSEEVLGRIASGRHHRNASWYGPLIIYIPTLLLGTLPWGVLLLRRLRSPCKGIKRLFDPAWRARCPEAYFLILWFALPLVAFCLSRSRLPLYLLPIMPPVAFAAGRASANWPTRQFGRVLVATACLFMATRWGSRYYQPRDKDGALMAKSIAAAAPFAPREVVFVDAKPVWGLCFYLGCEVAPVQFERHNRISIHSFYEELMADEKARVFVIDARQVARTMPVWEKAGLKPLHIGTYQGQELFVVEEH